MKFPTIELNKYFNNLNTLHGIFSVFGDFGVGKTTFALQTALNTARLGKLIVYIYTKPNFPSEKIKLINIYSENVLDNILFFEIIKFNELNSVIFNFEFLILHYLKTTKCKLELIIIDSLTNLYRLELSKEKKETNYNLNYQLNQILANLTYINEIYNIEILVVNEISWKNIDDQIIEVQSGGNVMKFWINNSLKISKTKELNERKFTFTNFSKNSTFEFLSKLGDRGFK